MVLGFSSGQRSVIPKPPCQNQGHFGKITYAAEPAFKAFWGEVRWISLNCPANMALWRSIFLLSLACWSSKNHTRNTTTAKKHENSRSSGAFSGTLRKRQQVPVTVQHQNKSSPTTPTLQDLTEGSNQTWNMGTLNPKTTSMLNVFIWRFSVVGEVSARSYKLTLKRVFPRHQLYQCRDIPSFGRWSASYSSVVHLLSYIPAHLMLSAHDPLVLLICSCLRAASECTAKAVSEPGQVPALRPAFSMHWDSGALDTHHTTIHLTQETATEESVSSKTVEGLWKAEKSICWRGGGVVGVHDIP